MTTPTPHHQPLTLAEFLILTGVSVVGALIALGAALGFAWVLL